MAPTISPTFDILEFVVNQRHGVKGLVDIVAPKILPTQYIQPPKERLDPEKIISCHESRIPLIDVSDWKNPNVAASMCEAARKWGLFQIVNHGIPLEILQGVREAAKGFFGLPVEERKKYWMESSVSKTAVLTTSFSPYNEAVLEWRDFVKFSYLPEEDDNFTALWPAICRYQVLDYFKRVEPIIKKILEIMISNLNVKTDTAKVHALISTLRMNFNYYPECPEPELAAGSCRHSDINTLTLLLQDDVGGLYGRATENGDEWIHVPPIEGALIVNIGDTLQIVSNDRYRSIEHRVVAQRSRSRVSIPIFAGPAGDTVIGPLPEVLEDREKPLYKEIIYSDYFKYFFGKGHDGKKTLDYIKI